VGYYPVAIADALGLMNHFFLASVSYALAISA
jgi:hypothetical protein